MSRFLALLLALFPLGVVAAEDYDPSKDLLGCGTILGMHPVNQRPQLTSAIFNRSGNTNDVAGPLVSGGVISLGIAVVAQIASSIYASKAKDKAFDDHVKATEFKNVMAIWFRFDSGQEVFMPVYVASGMRYSDGVRLKAYYAKFLDNIQLGYNPIFGSMPVKGDLDYDQVCGMKVDAEIGRSIIERSESLVDESKLIRQ